MLLVLLEGSHQELFVHQEKAFVEGILNFDSENFCCVIICFKRLLEFR